MCEANPGLTHCRKFQVDVQVLAEEGVGIFCLFCIFYIIL